MAYAHTNPDEAVRAHVDVGARTSLAIHYRTFPLTDEPIDAPERALAEALGRAGLAAGAFWTLAEGEGRNVP